MAATELLAVGNTAANSPDFTLASGNRATIALKGMVDQAAQVIVYLKDDVGNYNPIGGLGGDLTAAELSAPGTYRFSRVAGGTCGVFSA